MDVLVAEIIKATSTADKSTLLRDCKTVTSFKYVYTLSCEKEHLCPLRDSLNCKIKVVEMQKILRCFVDFDINDSIVITVAKQLIFAMARLFGEVETFSDGDGSIILWRSLDDYAMHGELFETVIG